MFEDYLRYYVTASQKNWLDLLDLAQFAYTEPIPFTLGKPVMKSIEIETHGFS